jgi:hypothetical protein
VDQVDDMDEILRAVDAGDAGVCLIPSGHDAWVVGNKPVVVVDVQGMSAFSESA